ncbi:MAG: hypothetical protein CSA58_11290 [Micrococcales bacterium]|nr:MAG: hypothetical protein CSB46_06760 [Micrococcales bacterium]PIE26039.1 MAG: hypothetical protein CSA58_11290 [Micrococcales bacterium]
MPRIQPTAIDSLGPRVQRSNAHNTPFAGESTPCAVLRRQRVRGGGHELVLVHHPASVKVGRHTLTSEVGETINDDELLHAVSVVVSELLGNAVRHAAPTAEGAIILRWQERGGVIDLEVRDGGSPGEVRPQRPNREAPGGRGLRIVRHLSDEWGVHVEPTSGLRTVWAALGGPSRRRRRSP